MILSVAAWPWLFLVNLPIGLVAVPVFLLIARPGQRHARPFDLSGALLSAVALGLLVVESTRWAVAMWAGDRRNGGSGSDIGLLVWQQSRRTAALLPLDASRIPLFSLSIVTSICSYSAQILACRPPFPVPDGDASIAGRDGTAGHALAALVVVAAPIAGRLTTRYPASILGSIGLGVLAVGLALLAALPDARGLGHCVAHGPLRHRLRVFPTPNNAAIMTAGPMTRSGAAGGMLAVARTLGWCLGSAMVTLIFAVSHANATIRCLELACAFAAAGALASVARFSVRR